MNMQVGEEKAIVIGGGPAGLAAATELLRQGAQPLVLEADDIIGGISRTQCYKGYHFDMGGHRFYTKSKEVRDFWQETLEEEFLVRPRLSRILYDGKFFKYPPEPIDALKGLGLIESIHVICSYMKWKILPYRDVQTFEQWVTNAFGKRLFEIFFKTYTEKVWGIPCTELRAEWAAQRIQGMSLKTVIMNFFKGGKTKAKSLIEEFHYPRLGPGMMWTQSAENLVAKGGTVKMRTRASQLIHANGKVNKVVATTPLGNVTYDVSNVFSSMPITQLIAQLDPPAPKAVQEAAKTLRYRDFLTVCVIVDKEHLFDDNWIYIHEEKVKVGRIQCYKNWSEDMVPDQSKTSLGLEYFCNEGDGLWTMSDAQLIELAKEELEAIGLADAADVLDGCVYRMPKSYPVYDEDYAEALESIKTYLDGFENLVSIGRNGMHRYNNQDHSMLTGIHAVRNIYCGQSVNIWKINGEDDYIEAGDVEQNVQIEPILQPSLAKETAA